MEPTNNKPIEIIAFHGWAFDAGFWESFTKHLPINTEFKPANRGYFGEAVLPQFERGQNYKILLSHSFGLSWIPESYFQKADLLVLFNSFIQFHPMDPNAAKASRRVLQMMIKGYEHSPESVLNQFWKNTYEPAHVGYHPVETPEHDLLLSDLKRLEEWNFEEALIDRELPLISLDSGKDAILQTPRGKGFTKFTENNSSYHLIQEAGHALPATRPLDCWSYINAMIPIFGGDGNNRK